MGRLNISGSFAGNFLKISAAFCLIALGLMFLQVRQDIRQTGTEARAMITESRDLVRDTRKKLDDTSSNLNAILIQAGLAADEARRASIEQHIYLSQVNKNLDSTFLEINQTVAQLRDTTQKVGGDVHEMSQATVTALNSLPPLLDQARVTLESTNKVISDPAIPATLNQVNQTMVAVTGTMQNVEKTTAHVEKRVQQMTKPAPLAKRILMSILDIGYKVKIIF